MGSSYEGTCNPPLYADAALVLYRALFGSQKSMDRALKKLCQDVLNHFSDEQNYFRIKGNLKIIVF